MNKYIHRELWLSFIRGRISKTMLRNISGIKSKYEFNKAYDMAVKKYGLKTGTNKELIKIYQ